MKLGVTGFPPLTFRALSMWLGLPVLGAAAAGAAGAVRASAAPTGRELAELSVTNMIVWHVLRDPGGAGAVVGRAAILGYTMPIFSALWGVAMFGERLRPRHVAGVARRGARRRPAALARVRRAEPAGRWRRSACSPRRPSGRSARSRCGARRSQAPTLAIVFWMTLATHAGDDRSARCCSSATAGSRRRRRPGARSPTTPS